MEGLVIVPGFTEVGSCCYSRDMGVEFKGKIMLRGFREVKCWWEGGEVGKVEG